MTIPMNESNSWFPEMHRRITTLTAERDALQQRVRELEAAMGDLLAEQAGPPLIRREAKWQAAMDAAYKLIHERPAEATESESRK